jgi:hypothetical protein
MQYTKVSTNPDCITYIINNHLDYYEEKKISHKNVIEELEIDLGDMEFRKNIRKRNNKYYHPFVMIELRKYIQIKKGLFCNKGKYYNVYNEPQYNGKTCVYKYLSLYHKKFKGNFCYTYEEPTFEFIKNDITVKKWFFETFYKKEEFYENSLNKDWNKNNWDNKMKNEFSFEDENTKKYNTLPTLIKGYNFWNKCRNTYYKSKKETTLKTIRVKVCIKTLDYTKILYPDLNIFNFKGWNKETKQTSNKGCIKISSGWTYTNNEGNIVEKYELGGLKTETLKKWALDNGFKEEREQTIGKKGMKSVKKKYYYGDYAEYMLKL